jgi:flavorubredoxin
VSDVHEIADGIFRISCFGPQAPVEFTQFLIKDERPLLFHTGARALFPDTLEAVRRVLGDAAALRYISWSHLESDECGAVDEFLAVAPGAEPVHGQISALVGNGDFFSRPARPMGDNDVLDLGQKKLRFLITPHVPHAWDAIMVFEETTRTLFVSDLFTVFGKPPATTEGDVVEQSMAALAQLPGYLPIGPHTAGVFDRLEALNPGVLAGHHASAITGDAVGALRDLRRALFRQAGLPDPA